MQDYNLIYIATHADEIFRGIRWEHGVQCECGSHDIVKHKDGRYKCKHCGKVFSDTSGTLFHGSKLPISYWMVALYLMISGKGISGYEMARKLQVSYRTAYYMMMRLRYAFSQDDVVLDSALVAHDEVYIGGDYRNFCLAKRQRLIERFNLPRNPKTVKEKIALGNAVNQRTKKACFGMTDGQRCVLIQVPTPIEQKDIVSVYTKHVTPNGLAVSDSSGLYANWKRLTGRELHLCNHSKGQYIADNGTSSNMIECVFSWLERTNICIHVHYSRKYTQLYLDEFAFRYNTRTMTVKDRLTCALKKCSQRYDTSLLQRLNEREALLYRESGWFNPRDFFRVYGAIINEYRDGYLVWRKEDWV